MTASYLSFLGANPMAFWHGGVAGLYGWVSDRPWIWAGTALLLLTAYLLFFRKRA